MEWRSMSQDDIKRLQVDGLRRLEKTIQEWVEKATAAVSQAESILAFVRKQINAKSGSREE